MNIYDNVLGKNALALIQKEIVNAQSFPWYKTITTDDSKDAYNIHDFSWFHMVLKDGDIASQSYSLIYPLLVSAFDYIGEPVNNFLRFRLALQTSIGQLYINDAHVDDTTPHKTAIMYLVNSDGPTIVYNEKYDTSSGLHSRSYRDNVLNNKLTVKQEVAPIENRLLVFDGLHYHASQRPVNHAYRVILNINYN
jgi:hypothetical protein